MKTEKIFSEVKKSYKELLPDVNPHELQEALDVCYREGMTSAELKKKTYAYLYPVREQLLW